MEAKYVSAALEVVERIYRALFEVSKITSQEIRVKCPDNIGVYSVAFEIKRGMLGLKRVVKRKIPFYHPDLRRVSMHSAPLMKSESDAIVYTENGFEILLDKLSKDTDTFWATIEYNIKDKNFLNDLVQRDRQTESISETEHKYWMHAQLKNLRALQTNYGRLDLQDVDFFVDVAVHQDIKTKIPKPFTEDLEIIARWISEKEREKKQKLSMEHLRTQRGKRYGGREQEVLSDLQELFLSDHFCNFIDVTLPFHYSDCKRGPEFYDTVPYPTFPKAMKVISRTDLNLDKPASEGMLVYKKKLFQDKISEVFSK